MASRPISVNNTDISTETQSSEQIPFDMMGLLFFAYRDFIGDADTVLMHQGFGRAHHRVLYFVNLRPGMSVADLLDVLQITKQSLARVLRQLIDNGYIEQRPGKSDRRQRLLFATEKGRDLFLTLTESQTKRIKRALEDLPEGSRELVKQFLARMVEDKDQTTLANLGLTTPE